MTRHRTALIIGAGIAGPATAMALQKAGIESVVYETHSGSTEGVGMFLTLGSNGIDALRVLDADKLALAASFPTPEILLRNASGRKLGESRTGGTLLDGTTSQTITRSDLYRALRQEASSRGLRFEHGKQLVAVQESPDGVAATFADGTHALGDLLIGCDGIHSTVRAIIDPAAPAPTYAGLLSTGGNARTVRVDSPPGSYEMIFGKQAFFGYALAPDGEVWWFANVPQRDEHAGDRSDSPGGVQQQLLDLFAADAGPATALIAATPQISALSPIHCVPHLPAWHRGRLIVIGDAAHAPSPTSGQGASLAIEDAVVLAKCLRDLPSHQEAFVTFERARRPRVERIIKRAARVNNSKAAGTVGAKFRDALLPIILKLTADSAADKQTFGYHIDWDATTLAAT